MMNAFSRAIFAAVFPLAFTGSLLAQLNQAPVPFPSVPDGNRVASHEGTDLMELKNEGFVPLFDGKTLDGWTEIHKRPGDSYFVTNGLIASPANAGNDLVTDQSFADYILLMDFKLTPGANNGVGIRVPFETNDLTYSGNEVQILDDDDPQYAKLEPGQYCGSLYKIFAAKRGALKKVGQWNHYEISAIGRHIKVVLNGQTIVDGNLNDVLDREVLRGHPGMLRESGHIALLGHWSYVEFKNIFIKELPVTSGNTPPEGFTPLFNGQDLAGWKGLVADPAARAKMSAEALAAAQAKADQRMRDHWKAQDGMLVFDGHGDNLCTAHDYGDFEMLVDWKIPPKGDSGIYLRGTPQVQIWEPNSPGQFPQPDGSGGLYNDQKNNRHPLVFADHPVGEWNRFRILMVGEKVHVFLNGTNVVRDTTFENYWEPGKPIYPAGQIELQNHGGMLWFKNIYLRELPPAAH
jgi:hypothetical protein